MTACGKHIGRCLQCLVAVILLALALPLVAVMALAIKLTSRGPVLFACTRLGLHGRPFRMVKFRTMAAGADEQLHGLLASSPSHAAQWQRNVKLDGDPRVTALGKILRMLSLDELPQLWNVLAGQMNIIGPRPITAEERLRYGAAFETVASVKPGITGLWQVSGRNDLGYEERIRLDVLYARCHSMKMDIVILAKTFVEILSAHGK